MIDLMDLTCFGVSVVLVRNKNKKVNHHFQTLLITVHYLRTAPLHLYISSKVYSLSINYFTPNLLAILSNPNLSPRPINVTYIETVCDKRFHCLPSAKSAVLISPLDILLCIDVTEVVLKKTRKAITYAHRYNCL